MGKFEKEAKQLLEAIGGKENVNAVTHCATRMRFVLADEKKANVKVIEDIPAVKGTFTNAGQFKLSSVTMYQSSTMTLLRYLVLKAYQKKLLSQPLKVTKMPSNVS